MFVKSLAINFKDNNSKNHKFQIALIDYSQLCPISWKKVPQILAYINLAVSTMPTSIVIGKKIQAKATITAFLSRIKSQGYLIIPEKIEINKIAQ